MTFSLPVQYNSAQRHTHSLKFLNYTTTYYSSQIAADKPLLQMTQSCVAVTFLPDAMKSSSVPVFTTLPSKTGSTGLSSPRKLGGKKSFSQVLKKSHTFPSGNTESVHKTK